MQDHCQLTHCGLSSLASADFVKLTLSLTKKKITQSWWAGLGVSPTRLKEEPDYHWDWLKVIARGQNDPYSDAWAVRTADGEIQGAIVFRIDAVSVLDEDSSRVPFPSVYCEYLATAPHNRRGLSPTPKYRGTGANLLLRAIAASYSLGFGGRIILASVPEAEAFYTAYGFVKSSECVDDMPIYELRPDLAEGKLKTNGWL